MDMINISSALDWWDVWKLRLLVLASTVIQMFLFLYGTARRYPVRRWFKVCIWFAYLAGDSLAIYALASLFNRHSRAAAATVGSKLEVLWAPVLLIHLAGQEQITAYSIQDNELWMRHVATLVSQVAIALYVFCVSWSGGERRLLAAAILMFIIGIYKFSTKPWALKRACFRNLVSSPASVPRTKKLIPGSSRIPWWLKNLTQFMVKGYIGDAPNESLRAMEEQQAEKEATEEDLEIGEYVRGVQEAKANARVQATSSTLDLVDTYAFAADILVPYSRRLKILQFMFNYSRKNTKFASAVRIGLGDIYSRLYTRVKVAVTPIGLFFRVVTFSMAIAAIALFTRTPKSHDDGVDVKVTYVLFSSIALLELLSFGNVLTLEFIPCLVWPAANFRFLRLGMVSQQSLISSAARRRKPTTLLWLAARIGYDDDVARHWYITHTPASDMIYEAVLAHVNKGLDEYIHGGGGDDPAASASYRRFNDLRGQWAVRKRLSVLHQLQVQAVHDAAAAARRRDVLLRSVRRPFDESVLLWHVATEICFHHADADGGSPRELARVISCYMMHLLSACPEMLMLGTRRHLFTVALDDIQFMLQCGSINEGDDRSIGSALLRLAKSQPWIYRDSIGPLIPRACELADALLHLLRLQEKETWEMVQDVWVEMLCYAASRGRGYMHAVNLAERWELLSRVWLLLCFLGMETLADRLQRAEEEQQGEHGDYRKHGTETSSSRRQEVEDDDSNHSISITIQ